MALNQGFEQARGSISGVHCSRLSSIFCQIRKIYSNWNSSQWVCPQKQTSYFQKKFIQPPNIFFEVLANKFEFFPKIRGGGYSRITSPWQIKYGESRGSTHKEILPQRLIIKNPGPPCLTIMVTAVYSVTSRVNEFEEKKWQKGIVQDFTTSAYKLLFMTDFSCAARILFLVIEWDCKQSS